MVGKEGRIARATNGEMVIGPPRVTGGDAIGVNNLSIVRRAKRGRF